jgi:zinc protease
LSRRRVIGRSRTNRGRSLGAALLLALGVGAPVAARATTAPAVPIRRAVLPNGLTVILAPDPESPLVAAELCYRVGSRDEPEGRAGLAAMVPRLMVRATTHVAEGQYDRALDSVGATGTRWTSDVDRTCFRTTVPSGELAIPVWLWSDQMGFWAGRLDQHLIDQELTDLRNEYVQKVENVPAGHLFELVNAAVFPPGHPYHRTALENGEGLRGIRVSEVRAFVASHYTPDRATLVLAGDLQVGSAVGLVQRYFGTIEHGAGAPRPSADPAPPAGERHLHVAARVEAAQVVIAWQTASRYAPGDAELDVVSELLTGYRAGILRIKLVDELGIATSVSARQISRALGSVFEIRATAAPGHSPAELKEAIDGVLRSLQAAGPNQYLLGGSIAGYVIDRLFALEGREALAIFLGHCDDQGISGNCLQSWTDRYALVDAARISAVVSAQLPFDRRVIVDVVPAADAPIGGELRSRLP